MLFFLSGLEIKHRTLKESVQEFVGRAQESLLHSKRFETEMSKIESWLKETEQTIHTQPFELDLPLQALQLQTKKYQVRNI